MKITVFTHPILSHINSINALTEPLISQGHELTYLTSKGIEWAIPRKNTTLKDIGPHHDGKSRYYDSLLKQKLFSKNEKIPEWFSGYCVTNTINAALDHIEHDNPELIIRNPVDLSSILISAKYGIPLITHGWSKPFSFEFFRKYWLNNLVTHGKKIGISSEKICQSFYDQVHIHTLPRKWFDNESTFHNQKFFCLKPNNINDYKNIEKVGIDKTSHDKTIYISCGTNFAEKNYDNFITFLSRLGDLKANIIATTGVLGTKPDISAIPDNIQIFDYIPNNIVLPTVDLVVFHGGFNTLHDCIYWNKPCVVSPIADNDQPEIANRIQSLNLGHHCINGWRDSHTMYKSVASALEDDSIIDSMSLFNRNFLNEPGEAMYIDFILRYLQ